LVSRNSKWSCKFYESQLEYWDEKLKEHFKENKISKFDADQQYEILKQSEENGITVDWDTYYKRLEDEDTSSPIFPITIQNAFIVWNYLTPNWEGMGGTYLGKFMQGIKEIMDVLEIEDQKITLEFVQKIDGLYGKMVNDKLASDRKAAERKNSVRKK